ncbi:hypothetical protein FRB97_001568 [Tulasnella sp. 331]|nr:hypothetical protein FRB97_001568 [Tulasnella sp. 331]
MATTSTSGLHEGSTSLVAALVSLILEGIYVCLFVLTIYVMHHKKVSMRSPSIILISLVFICNLAEAVSSSSWRTATLMCYRTYIVWSRDRRTLYLPCITLPVGVIASITLVVFDAIGADMPIFLPVSETLSLLTIVMTWYFTSLICYRLWSMERQKRRLDALNDLVPEVSDGAYRKVGGAMIESGLLFSFTQGALFVCYLLNSTSGVIVIGYLNIRIVGIATALIMLQLHGGFKTREFIAENGNASGNRPTSTAYSIPVFRVIGPHDTAGAIDAAECRMSDEGENEINHPRHDSRTRIEFLEADGTLLCLPRAIEASYRID